jgi:hypothetical protein
VQGVPIDQNLDWRYSLENSWNAPLKAGISVWGKAKIQRQLCRKLRFDEMNATWFTNGHTFPGGLVDRIPNCA